MAYRTAQDLRFEACRDRALSFEDVLPPGAFNALPRATGNALQQLRDRCDALHDRPDDFVAAALLWTSYEMELSRVFGPEDRARGAEQDQVLTAIKWRFALNEGGYSSPSQPDAAAMVALARDVDPEAEVAWLSQRILVTKLALRAQPLVLVVRRKAAQVFCIAGVRITRRAPGLIVEPGRTLARALARDDEEVRDAFAKRFVCRGPRPELPHPSRSTLVHLDRHGGMPMLEQRDGLASLTWRQPPSQGALDMLAMMAALRRAYPPPIDARPSSAAAASPRRR